MKPLETTRSLGTTPTDAINPRAVELFLLLRVTHDAIVKRVEQDLAQWGVSMIKYHIIRHLANDQRLSLTELSERVFTGNSNMTRVIDRMEADGLVERVGDTRDRRRRDVVLTTKGKEIANGALVPHREYLTAMLSCYSEADFDEFICLLSKVKGHIEEWMKNGANLARKLDENE